MAKQKTRSEVREIARQRIQYFSAVLDIDEQASVRRGKRKHLDPSLPDTPGYWVDCKVFVPEEDLNDGE